MLGNLPHRARQVRDLLRRDGLVQTCRMIWVRLRHGPGQWSKTDVIGYYEFLVEKKPLSTQGVAGAKTMLWVIPDFNIGSGGHLNIFRTIYNLEPKGYVSTILIVGGTTHVDAKAGKKEIVEHVFAVRAEVIMDGDVLPSTEYVVATGWQTAYHVNRLPAPSKKVYFAQDFEPLFYPAGSEYVFSENTYHFGFYGITAGQWLADKLSSEYAMQAKSVGFGVDERYKAHRRREPEIKRVFFYARPPTARRAFELGLVVLDLVHKRLPHVQFVLAGWDTENYRIPFPHLSCGTVGLDDLPDLYSQCDVALVLSLTNLSLLPLELMACRCAVVSNRGENVEWLLNDDIAILADLTPDSLADAVCRALTDDAYRVEMMDRAEQFASTQNWDDVAVAFEAGLVAAREAV